MKKIINNELKDMALYILNGVNKFTNNEELNELDHLFPDDKQIILKQYSYSINIIEIIRTIANGELGIPLEDRLKIIELITEQLKGNLSDNIIEIDFTNGLKM
ncbi:hypothetical protein [Clostridium butyricum]|uniref:hypothetical protein n=1 Tax=Clostridium butyricum TaxID=1492 RepID=UPI0012B97B67|nr:hypothetical protein [Clostridium butyricum]